MKTKLRSLTLALAASSTLFGIASCANQPFMRDEIAHRMASPALMVERQIPASPFMLTSYERMHEHNAPATVYIEGDGLAWLSRNEISLDPTPTNPVALNLAAMDKAKNVAYLARPCQFSKMIDKNTACPAKYWTNERFAPDVINAMNAALDNIKHQYDITEFNLVGFSGGANIAALLAAARTDVVSYAPSPATSTTGHIANITKFLIWLRIR
ncbi:MAG: hypothetical protein LRY54_00110 [Alphaproteobacteria bacterium]|nr:hypothetical protein [Alphaproteobacteria bacterium]